MGDRFEYKYRGCTAEFIWEGVWFLSVYDDDNDFDYGVLNEYEKMGRHQLKEEARCWIDDIRDKPEEFE